MATAYPAAVDAFVNPTPSDPDTNPPHAQQHADANDAIEAIETELGVLPSGADATVAARLDRVDADIAAVVSDTDAALALKSDTTHNHDGVYDPAGTAATQAADAIQTHVDQVDPHYNSAYTRLWHWNADQAEWQLLPGGDIFVRTVGAPDPVNVMGDADILIDASGL